MLDFSLVSKPNVNLPGLDPRPSSLIPHLSRLIPHVK